jgi:hypothetical protein
MDGILFTWDKSQIRFIQHMRLTYQLAPQLTYTEHSRPTRIEINSYIDTDGTVAFVVRDTK